MRKLGDNEEDTGDHGASSFTNAPTQPSAVVSSYPLIRAASQGKIVQAAAFDAQEEHNEIVKRTEIKKHTLLSNLAKIEKKRVKGVQDTLDKSDILQKLQRTETVLEKMKKHGARYDAKKVQASELFPETLKAVPVTSTENMDLLR